MWLITQNMQDDLAPMRRRAVLEDIDPLPCSKNWLAIEDGYRELRIGERGSDVCGHVVGALHGMAVQFVVFRRQTTEMIVEIGDHVRVGILLNCQRG